MGVPILRPDPDPLPAYKGYFSAHMTDNEVGSHASEVFVQREASIAFQPLVSLDGGTLQPAWAGQRVHWLSGAYGEGGAYFRVLPHGQLEYLGTSRHPTPGYLGFITGEEDHTAVSPGYVLYLPANEGEDSGDDDEGYHDAPAVYVGGEPPGLPPAGRPSCLQCRDTMHFVGHVESDVFSDDTEERTILLWYCPDCRVQCCLDRR